MYGVWVELEICGPKGCAVAELVAGSGGTARSVRWTSSETPVVEQFRYDGGDLDASPIFEYDAEVVYEVTRSNGECVCPTIEALGCPISDVRVEDGNLFVSLHLDGNEDFPTVLERLEPICEDVRVRHLTYNCGDEPSNVVPVDLDRLTDRQRQVLVTAYERGYFDRPRGASAETIASDLGISVSTFSEHLGAAVSKLVRDLFDGRT